MCFLSGCCSSAGLHGRQMTNRMCCSFIPMTMDGPISALKALTPISPRLTLTVSISRRRTLHEGAVTAPQCTPSRAGVITGMYQNRFGVEHNNLAMKQEVVTLPERLKQSGYVTGISGKWHLDIEGELKEKGRKTKFNPELLPHKQGFDEYFTGFMNDYLASHALDGTPFADAPHAVRDERCRVVIQTDAALSFIDRQRKSQSSHGSSTSLIWHRTCRPSLPSPGFLRHPRPFPSSVAKRSRCLERSMTASAACERGSRRLDRQRTRSSFSSATTELR